ncbi:MAG: hypothetical protein ACJASR_002281 [Psychroserpens sp.]|jgi:hypothetical protein
MREIEKKYFLTPTDWLYLFKRDPSFALNYFVNLKFPRTLVGGKFTPKEAKFVNEVVKENKNNHNDNIDFNDSILHEFIIQNSSIIFVIFRAPQHPNYYSTLKNSEEETFQSRFNAFESYSNCMTLDFGFDFKNDHLFSDLEHLNSVGASHFTEKFADTLRKDARYKALMSQN